MGLKLIMMILLPHTGLEWGEQTSLQEVVNQQPRRSTRERKLSIRYPSSNYVFISNGREPESYYDVLNHKDKDD